MSPFEIQRDSPAIYAYGTASPEGILWLDALRQGRMAPIGEETLPERLRRHLAEQAFTSESTDNPPCLILNPYAGSISQESTLAGSWKAQSLEGIASRRSPRSWSGHSLSTHLRTIY
jgi:hypothetical protein